MRYTLTDADLATLSTPCLITTPAQARKIARATGNSSMLKLALRDFDESADGASVVHLEGSVARLVVVGGATGSKDQAKFRKLCQTAFTQVLKLDVKQAVVALDAITV